MARHGSAVAATKSDATSSRVRDISDALMTMDLPTAMSGTAAGQRTQKGIVRKKPARKKTPQERKRYRDKNKGQINQRKKDNRLAKKQKDIKRFKLAHSFDDIRNHMIPDLGDQ